MIVTKFLPAKGHPFVYVSAIFLVINVKRQMTTVEFLYSGHPWDMVKCPEGVSSFQGWVCTAKHTF